MKMVLLFTSVALASASLVAASAANATASIGGSLGFAPATMIDFETAGEGVVLDSFYAGLGVSFTTLGQTYTYSGAFPPNLAGGGAINFNSVPVNDWTISFANPISDAGFSIVTDFSATLSTYLGATFVESITYVGGYNPGADIISFTNSNFDSIRFVGTGDQLSLIDNLGFVAVPEPASWAMLITGFGLVGAVARRRRTVVAV